MISSMADHQEPQAESHEAFLLGTQSTGRELIAWLEPLRPTNGDPDAGIAAIREARDRR